MMRGYATEIFCCWIYFFLYSFFFPFYNSSYRAKGTESRGYNFKNFIRYHGTEPIAKLKYDMHKLEDVCALETIPLVICIFYKLWISPLGTLFITISLYHYFVKILIELRVFVSLNTYVHLI